MGYRLPNLVIIGGMKCGTSSLHYYLNLHPQIQMSQTKELNFFVDKKEYIKGVEWYKTQFSDITEVSGETSPNYTKYPRLKGVPERMYGLIPNAKLIYIVRDPIQRVISHWIHSVAAGREKRSLNKALSNSRQNHYINCSLYYMQTEQFLSFYPSDKLLIATQEELLKSRLETLRRIFLFLQVDPNFSHEEFSREWHKSQQKGRLTALGSRMIHLPRGKWLRRKIPWLFERSIEKPILDNSLYQRIANIFHEDVEKLRAFTGKPFPDWRV